MKLRPRSGVEIAGWLLADILLLLALIGIADSLRVPASAESGSVASTTTTTTVVAEPPGSTNGGTLVPTSAAPTPTTEPLPGLNREPVVITLDWSNPEGALEQVRQKLQQAFPFATPRAGFVIALGNAPENERNRGIAQAELAVRRLREGLPEIFSGVSSRLYWNGPGQVGRVKLEIFVFV